MPELPPFRPVSLEEMDSVSLLNRIDSKYLTDERTLEGILADAQRCGYRALVADGEMISHYDTIYYDTPGHQMFLDHRNQRLVRQKVRTREYLASGRTFLEIKRKNNHGRTKKKRTEIPPAVFRTFPEDIVACAYLACHSDFDAGNLTPALETRFRRITLVNEEMTERLTIDTQVSFSNLRNGREASLKNGVVIELKQDGRTQSRMKGILLDHRVKPVRVSKYCIGITLTDPEIPAGRFKEKLRLIEKQIKDTLYDRT